MQESYLVLKIQFKNKSLFFSLMKRTKNQGWSKLWIRGYDLWMKLIFVDFKKIWIEIESLFFCLIKRTKNQGWRQLWFRGYDLWMKLIFVDFKMVLTEMESLFFCLIKRTKNQGCGMVVKAPFSDFLKIIAPMRFILFAPERLILSVIFCEATDKI